MPLALQKSSKKKKILSADSIYDQQKALDRCSQWQVLLLKSKVWLEKEVKGDCRSIIIHCGIKEQR